MSAAGRERCCVTATSAPSRGEVASPRSPCAPPPPPQPPRQTTWQPLRPQRSSSHCCRAAPWLPVWRSRTRASREEYAMCHADTDDSRDVNSLENLPRACRRNSKQTIAFQITPPAAKDKTARTTVAPLIIQNSGDLETGAFSKPNRSLAGMRTFLTAWTRFHFYSRLVLPSVQRNKTSAQGDRC